MTPSQEKFLQKAHDDAGTLIRHKHKYSDEVLVITQGTKSVIPYTGYWCTKHGGFNYAPCECRYETRMGAEMWRPVGMTLHDVEMFNQSVVAWADGVKGLSNRAVDTSPSNLREFFNTPETVTHWSSGLPKVQDEKWRGTLGIPPKEFKNE